MQVPKLSRYRMKVFFLFIMVFGQSDASADPAELREAGAIMRLQGDQEGTYQVYKQLVTEYPADPIGYVFNLNTSLSNLTWDPQIKESDQDVTSDANAVFDLCERAISANRQDHQAYYECGQANLMMAYLSAIRGNYYRAGRHCTLAVKQLERALSLKPTLVEAKMHLGVAYYYIDYLPPFLKLLSSVLWFIPKGNTEKSIPYLAEAANTEGYRGDEAKYVYADVLSRRGIANVAKATQIFRELDKRYPNNERFGLLYISLLLEQKLFNQTVSAGREFLLKKHDKISSGLALLWISRAYLGLGDNELAIATFSQIDDFETADFPPWGKAWLFLTAGQLADSKGDLPSAISYYEDIFNISYGYIHPTILETAKNRIETLSND